MKSVLVKAIADAMAKEQTRHSADKRGSCSADNCPHDAIAKGWCNAHYLRAKAGRKMDAPLRAYSTDGECVECREKLNGKGGWLRCAKHFKLARQQTIKDALVDAMGGCCQNCGGVFPSAAFDFHHVGEKEEDPSKLISNNSVERIAQEIERCVLLCANCHRIEHARKFC
jgi:hypothetical protein